MDLVVVRHAIAQDRADFSSTGQSDELRPLTEKGRSRMVEGARGLATLIPKLDVLATSPLVRARQTADIVSEEFGGVASTVVEALRPEAGFEDLEKWLAGRSSTAVLAVVGHEPHLSGLVNWLLAEGETPVDSLKKGAACLIRFPEKAAREAGRLRWCHAPAELRAMGAD